MCKRSLALPDATGCTALAPRTSSPHHGAFYSFGARLTERKQWSHNQVIGYKEGSCRLRSALIHAGLLAAGLSIAGTIGPAAGDVNFTPKTCVRAPHDQLCPHYPDDQTDFSAVFEYRLINTASQDPFDHHAWQAFVALNWPLAADGTPAAALAAAPDAPDTRRAWSRFARRDDVFRRNRAATCPDSDDAAVHTHATWRRPTARSSSTRRAISSSTKPA